MWLVSHSSELINLEHYRMLRIVGDRIVARSADEQSVLFIGDHESLTTVMAEIVEGLASGKSFLDLPVPRS